MTDHTPMPPHARARLRMDMIQYKEMGYHDMKMNRLAAAMCAALMLTAAVPVVTMMEEVTIIAKASYASDLTDDGYGYWIKEDDTVSITYYNGTDTEYLIPSEIDGLPVSDIAPEAFKNCNVTSVTIPEGVKLIGSQSFMTCSFLTSVTILEGVTVIGAWAFSGCEKLEYVSIPASMDSICDFAFLGCKSLTHLKIPEGVTEIDYGAFADCTSLSSLILPKSVTTIEEEAFSGCTSLTLSVYKDSYAHKYAETNSIPYVLIGGDATLGDVNGDGSVDATDASDILVASTEKAVGHENALTEAQQKAADVNKDGQFDAVDASYILIYSTRKGTGQESAFGDLFE